MKCLQDLVPGCNKVTGKAEMLDEIINYVHSLQKQVEFLSTKLAATNPRLEFNIDNFFAKELTGITTRIPIQSNAPRKLKLHCQSSNGSNVLFFTNPRSVS